MSFRAFARWVPAGLLMLCVFGPLLATAENIPVRFAEGLSRGFLVVSDESGHKIGNGDDEQVLHGNEINNRLTIRFREGSFYEETTVFTQQKAFRLISDHVIEKGPSFKNPIDGSINASSGRVNVRYTDGHGKQKMVSKKMQLPPDIANGMLFTLVKDFDSRSPKTTLSYVSLGAHPLLVKLVFTLKGKSLFVTGGVKRDAIHYVMHVDIGGVAGVVAPLIGKQPHDKDIWVLDGDAPAYAGSLGPLYAEGPVWRITLVSPEESSSAGSGH